MREYNPKDIESKWQDIWDENETFNASYDKDKPYFYNYGVDLLLKYMINLKDCSGSDFEIIEEDSEDNPFLYFG